MWTNFIFVTTIISLVIAFIGLVIALVGYIIIPLHALSLSQGNPDLILVDSHPFDYPFPPLVRIRNRGSAPANKMGIVIFPEQFTCQRKGIQYIANEHVVAGQQEVDIARQNETSIPAAWKIGTHTVAPNKKRVTARLTLTYADDQDHIYAGIFDYDHDRRKWKKVASLKGLRFDIVDLEKEFQQRSAKYAPHFNGFDPKRRVFIFLGITIAVIGLGGGVGVREIVSFSRPPNSGKEPSPTPTLGGSTASSPTSSSGGGTAAPSRSPAPAGTTLFTYSRHMDQVNVLAWLPSGTRIVSGSADTTVQVWDALNGNHRLIYTGHSSDVNAVACSSNGRYVASGSDDKTVQVWNATTGQKLLTYTGHSGTVFSATWSPDGLQIASGGDDKTIQVWNATTGQTTVIYIGHKNGVGPVAWSPNGKSIASGSDDKTVQVWNATTGQTTVTYIGHTSGVNTVAWSPDGGQITSGSNDQTVQVWNATTGKQMLTYHDHTGAVMTVGWQPRGKVIASGGADKTVKIWQSE